MSGFLVLSAACGAVLRGGPLVDNSWSYSYQGTDWSVPLCTSGAAQSPIALPHVKDLAEKQPYISAAILNGSLATAGPIVTSGEQPLQLFTSLPPFHTRVNPSGPVQLYNEGRYLQAVFPADQKWGGFGLGRQAYANGPMRMLQKYNLHQMVIRGGLEHKWPDFEWFGTWGTGNMSEVNGIEVQLYHRALDLNTKCGVGTGVLAFAFVESSGAKKHPFLASLLQAGIPKAKNDYVTLGNLDVASLVAGREPFGDGQRLATDFMMYQGSIPSPPCTEGVPWFVRVDPISVPTSQLEDLKKVMHTYNPFHQARKPMPLKGREVSLIRHAKAEGLQTIESFFRPKQAGQTAPVLENDPDREDAVSPVETANPVRNVGATTPAPEKVELTAEEVATRYPYNKLANDPAWVSNDIMEQDPDLATLLKAKERTKTSYANMLAKQNAACSMYLRASKAAANGDPTIQQQANTAEKECKDNGANAEQLKEAADITEQQYQAQKAKLDLTVKQAVPIAKAMELAKQRGTSGPSRVHAKSAVPGEFLCGEILDPFVPSTASNKATITKRNPNPPPDRLPFGQYGGQ
mmetsp:Transcript_29873/g.68027  ORF Transcript_29873/g.68027 Transcript_29873/m.68027 type:complete len:576 (+) Transcript_29873:77-1804(+)|eukprot:CAMPEP_0204322046 /NCGR_PEP_ID=MMETSP0469-20131031/8479_1 /ASSEMBLY_ACC=CAM_ASM_000384 /TAXON_ID=2969 /ORGANISM="Oxyrrhis marina" /LENGTH=575 /DNA_ID=CAMNT_0051303369 /DNA_START=149 /DNA_END=1876 /DNA_ORIENTATION=-